MISHRFRLNLSLSHGFISVPGVHRQEVHLKQGPLGKSFIKIGSIGPISFSILKISSHKVGARLETPIHERMESMARATRKHTAQKLSSLHSYTCYIPPVGRNIHISNWSHWRIPWVPYTIFCSAHPSIDSLSSPELIHELQYLSTNDILRYNKETILMKIV